MLTRRGFLGALVGGAAVAATASVARTFPFRVFSFPSEVKTYATISEYTEYADYVNFSSFAIAKGIDAAVIKAVHELAYNLGVSVDQLSLETCHIDRRVEKLKSLGRGYGLGRKPHFYRLRDFVAAAKSAVAIVPNDLEDAINVFGPHD